MALDLFIPEIDKKPKNTKDAIISILITEWPLTLKKIFNRIKSQYRFSCTYQSVYKSVKELLNKNILKKKGYEIDIGWIKELQSFTDMVETNYYAKKRFKNVLGVSESKSAEDLVVLNFKTIFDAEKYLYYFIKKELMNLKNQVVCYQLNNEWMPLFYLRAEYNFFKKLIKKGHKFYFLCSGDSYLEEISKKFYEKIGINVKTVKQNFPCDTIVFKDYFIQIFIPENIKKKMREYLDKKDIITLLEKVLEKEDSIKVIINKDFQLVNAIKKQVLQHFK